MLARNGKDRTFDLKSEWPAFIVIAAFVVLLMWPFTLGGQELMPDTWKSIHPWARGADLQENQCNIYDTVIEYTPWFEYAQKCLKEGRVPHWNPWQFCGAPLYANRLIPFFFPPFVVAALVSSPHKLIGWFQLFNLVISGWGMYLLLRRWALGTFAAIVSSCLWLTCGVHFLPFPLWTLGTVGFPWLIWALDGFLDSPSLRNAALASVISGLILMVGYPVLVVHLSYFTAIYFLSRWWAIRRQGPDRLHWSVPVAVIAFVFIAGFGIASVANVPAWEYSKHTVRNVAGFTDRAFEREKRILITPPAEAGLDPLEARFGERADIFLPINGRGTQRAWQHGGLPLYLLALLGFLSRRARTGTLAFLALAFGAPVLFPEVYLVLVDVLPGWSVTILPPVEALNLATVLLAAFGLETLAEGQRQPGLFSRVSFAAALIGSIALVWSVFLKAPVMNLPILPSVTDRNLLAHSEFHRFYLAGFVFLCFMIGLILFSPRTQVLFGKLACAIVVAFSVATFWYLQPVYSRNSMPPRPFTQWLTSNVVPGNMSAGGNRMARWADLPLPFNPHKRAKSPFTPNVHLPYGVMDTGGYDSLVPRRFIEYCTLFEDAFIDYRALIAFRAPSTMFHTRFRDLAVKWIISQGELPEESRQGCRLVWDDRVDGVVEGTDQPDDFIQVWEITSPRPRAFLTRRVVFSNDPSESPLVLSVNLAAQGVRAVVVEDPSAGNRSWAFPEEQQRQADIVLPDGSVSILSDEPERITLQVSAPVECYLVLRDGWYPEWEAFVDSVRSRIYPADTAFRAVRVPAGEHVIEFRYNPRSFRLGVSISAFTTLIVILLCFLPLEGKRGTRAPQPRTDTPRS